MRKSTVIVVLIFVSIFLFAFISGCEKEEESKESINKELITANPWYFIDSTITNGYQTETFYVFTGNNDIMLEGKFKVNTYKLFGDSILFVDGNFRYKIKFAYEHMILENNGIKQYYHKH